MVKVQEENNYGAFWTRSKTMQLIELYKAREALWRCGLKDHRNRDIRDRLLAEISGALKVDIPIMKWKIHILRTTFSRHLRVLKQKTEKGSNTSYQVKWEFRAPMRFITSSINSEAAAVDVLVSYCILTRCRILYGMAVYTL